MEVVKIYNEYKKVIFLSIFLIIIGVVIVGCTLMPSLFYDQWIWKYYWGPIVSDAAGHSVSYNNIYVHEGYTILSEITYGVLLVICILKHVAKSMVHVNVVKHYKLKIMSKTRPVVDIQITEGEAQELLDAVLNLQEGDEDELVFTWNPLDDKGNPVEVNIYVES